MAGIMSQQQADELASRNMITPEQHASISAANGSPPVSYDTGYQPNFEALDGGSVNAPAMATSPENRGLSNAFERASVGVHNALAADSARLAAKDAAARGMTVDQMRASRAAPEFVGPPPDAAPPPAMAPPPPAPTGDVTVGPITAAPPSHAAPAPAPPPPAGAVSMHGASFYNPSTGAPMAPPRAATLTDPHRVAQAARDEQLDVQAQAARDAGQARQDRAREIADLADRTAKEQQAIETANQAERVKEQVATDNAIADVRRGIEERASMKVDPGEYWGSLGTGQKIAAAIAVGLGGFAEGLSGGAVKNTALQMINRYSDQSIRAQEFNLQSADKSIDAKRGILHDMMQLTGSKEAARSAAKIAMLQNVKMQTEAISAKTDPKLEKSSTQTLLAGLETEKVNEHEKLEALLRSERAAQAAGARAAAASERNYRDARDDKKFEQGKEMANVRNKERELDIEERKTGAGPKSASKEDTAYITDMRALDDAWKQAVETNPGNRVSGMLGRAVDSDNASQNAGATAALVGFVKGPGDSSESDAIRLQSMLPRPGDDETTLSKKYAMLTAKIAQKHPEAARRVQSRAVKTVAAPGGK